MIPTGVGTAGRAVQRRSPAEELDAGHRGERPRRPDLGLVPAVGRRPPDQRGRTTNTQFGVPITTIGPGGVPIVTPTSVTVGTQGFRPDTEYGYALQAGAKINLPWIAPGDLLYLQAAYARGGLDYTISGNWVFGGATGSQGGFGGTLGRFAVNTVDGIVDQFGETNLSRSWSVVAAFLHYWTPQLRSGFSVGYSNVEYPGANTLFVGGVIPGTVLNPAPGAPPFAFGSAAQTFATTGTLRDFRLVNLAANLIWSPVRDLDIGVEVAYDRINVSGRVVDLNKCGNVAVFPAGFFGAGTPAQVCGYHDQPRRRVARTPPRPPELLIGRARSDEGSPGLASGLFLWLSRSLQTCHLGSSTMPQH